MHRVDRSGLTLYNFGGPSAARVQLADQKKTHAIYGFELTDRGDRKSRIEPEMLVGVSAVVIGVCALGVSLYETSLMRTEQRAAVVPLLELSRSYYSSPSDDGRDSWRLQLLAENVGIGPARVLDFRVTVDGVPQPSWNTAMQALLGREQDVRYGQSTINGRTVPADRLVTMFQISDTSLIPELVGEFDRLDFAACFCSIFDECWTTSYSQLGISTPVEACRAGEASFRE